MNTRIAFPLIIIFCLALTACAQQGVSTTSPPLHVQYTFAAQPWLEDLQSCAGQTGLESELRGVEFFDMSQTDMAIRISDQELTTSAYQIATETIIVAVNPSNPITKLTPDQVRSLFTGAIQNWESISGQDAAVQVWSFAAGEDIQQVFIQAALNGAPITSQARLASDLQEMTTAISADVNAIGILTGRWSTPETFSVYTVANEPVLVLLPPEPLDSAVNLLACLQK